jgi:DNA polymerase-3 subunit delta
VKLQTGRIAAFLKQPDPRCRAVLLYGPDAGLVRERAEGLVRWVSPDPADPFRVAELTGAALVADPARLADEMAAQSLVGGRRVVRIREAGDAVAPIAESALATAPGDGFVVIEAGDLPGRSALRKLFESIGNAAAVPCYLDSGRDLADVVRATLGAHRVEVTPDALAYLVENLGGDRQVTRSELEKLALHVGDGGKVGLAEAAASVGDTAALTIEDAIYAAADGDPAALDRALSRGFQEGEAPVSVLRAAQRHIHRLQLCRGRIESGQSAEDAMRSLRPPLFFKLQDRFAGQLRRWTPAALARAVSLLTQAELDAKTTVYPQETICRAALLDLARLAHAGRRRAA